jgi:predicted metal-dependent RNase
VGGGDTALMDGGAEPVRRCSGVEPDYALLGRRMGHLRAALTATHAHLDHRGRQRVDARPMTSTPKETK